MHKIEVYPFFFSDEGELQGFLCCRNLEKGEEDEEVRHKNYSSSEDSYIHFQGL